ncbi:MAG: nucleoside kinase, partial [Bacteroidales bacterium]|nr:nucleoside kinase [Bacteroidales bacterium]
MMQIYCKNTKTTKSFQEGTSLQDILAEFDFEKPYPIVSAKVNNVSQGLKFRVFHNRDVEFIDVRDTSGMRVYSRSLCFLLCKAASDEFPGSKIFMEHPISRGYFCRLEKADGSKVTKSDITKIRTRMQEIVDKDMYFHRHEVQ